MNTTNKAAKNGNGKIDDKAFFPKFRTPSAGGSYLKAANDNSPPVLVHRTSHELTSSERSSLQAEEKKVKTPANTAAKS